ncbi:hypothetical protein, partial [Frankia sp. CiP3]|uniref:hypothetical protein n=1 Tax=Frankia sp. CiP3 TaxID=2880971 RepID=UPI001EF3F714
MTILPLRQGTSGRCLREWDHSSLGLVPAGELMTGGRGSFIGHDHQMIDNMFAGYGSRDLTVTASTAGTHLHGLVAFSDKIMTR